MGTNIFLENYVSAIIYSDIADKNICLGSRFIFECIYVEMQLFQYGCFSV